QKQKKLIMLPSETMIWQPEFTDKTLSRKPGAVQNAIAELTHKYWKPEKKFIAKLANVILSAGANSCVTGNSFRQFI
ncbi:hypothetical protein ABUT92_13790, partial [Escherichia coli]|uniref:hypothetical protein n=2 Tax=Escherichia coli TaxID=562 RepID=UPI00334665D7